MNYKNTGFTLIEMLIAVSLVGILSVMANETYTAYLTRSHRLQAEMALMQGSAALERYALQTGSYQGATLATLSLPTALEPYYRVSLEVSPNHYTLIAEPLGTQAERDDVCGSLRLTSEGDRSACLTGEGAGFALREPS